MLEKLDHEIDPTVTSIHIVLDNLRMHKGKQVKACLANHPAFSSIISPSIAPG